MPTANANHIRIAYEIFGDSSSPAVLLIAGLGAQLPCWNTDFCEALADRGFYVIRYDNRDVGLSTKIEGLTLNELMNKIGAFFMGQEPPVPYGIEDMAGDGAGLLDALGIDTAHIAGMSMGGFIAQALCLRHPSCALSLTSIYSHTGKGQAFRPADKVMEALLAPVPEDRNGYMEYMTRFFKLIYGTGLPFDEDFHRNLAGRYFDRCFCKEGIVRQYLAILSQKDRTAELSGLNIPALVIHGDDDPLVPPAGGKATAAAIPGSVLKIIPGMGHVQPNLNAYWSDILDEMVGHMRLRRPAGS